MDLAEATMAALFAAAILIVFDQAIWWWTRLGLSMDYERCPAWGLPRAYPGHTKFLIVKLLLSVLFMAAFVVTDALGPSDHLDLAFLTLGLLVPFGAAAARDRVKAFRHYAAEHLPPVDRDGYVRRD